MGDPAGGDVLVLNVGSSSIKCVVFDAALHEVLRGGVDGIGHHAALRMGALRQPVTAPDHGAALSALLKALEAQGIAMTSLRVAGHRVVH